MDYLKIATLKFCSDKPNFLCILTRALYFGVELKSVLDEVGRSHSHSFLATRPTPIELFHSISARLPN